MGVVYKLKPEIINFIIEKKKATPGISCRGIVAIVNERFQVVVSKSSVNTVFKFAGLSQPVGRRRKPRRGSVAGKGFGCLLLKACDTLVGGSALLVAAAKSVLSVPEAKAREYLDQLLYSPHFDSAQMFARKNEGSLGGGAVSLASFSEVGIAPAYARELAEKASAEVYYSKLVFPSGRELFIDPRSHTIWSTPHIPSAFSLPIHQVMMESTGHFFVKTPFNFLMVPGYEAPTGEFMEFVSLFSAQVEKNVKVIFGVKNKEEVDFNQFDIKGKIPFIFGLWPWQFGQYRNIKMSSQRVLFYFEPLKQDFYLSEVDIELVHPPTQSTIILRGCAIQNTLTDPVRVFVLTNFTKEECSLDGLAGHYLKRWYALEGAFRDFSSKMEVFALGKEPLLDLGAQEFPWQFSAVPTMREVAQQYLSFLQWYLSYRILPSKDAGAMFKDIPQLCFELPGMAKKRPKDLFIQFSPPEQFTLRPQLAYACRRFNELGLSFDGAKQVWFFE